MKILAGVVAWFILSLGACVFVGSFIRAGMSEDNKP
jgi:hypothetical protein